MADEKNNETVSDLADLKDIAGDTQVHGIVSEHRYSFV